MEISMNKIQFESQKKLSVDMWHVSILNDIILSRKLIQLPICIVSFFMRKKTNNTFLFKTAKKNPASLWKTESSSQKQWMFENVDLTETIYHQRNVEDQERKKCWSMAHSFPRSHNSLPLFFFKSYPTTYHNFQSEFQPVLDSDFKHNNLEALSK